jgi:hypothetical protein
MVEHSLEFAKKLRETGIEDICGLLNLKAMDLILAFPGLITKRMLVAAFHRELEQKLNALH